MRVPRPVYRIQRLLARRLPLTPVQTRWLAHWVCGTLVAHSACQSAVAAALARHGHPDALRQYLREGLYDGADRAAPCRTALPVQACFGPLLSFVLRLWRSRTLVLALDATTRADALTVLCVSVLYRASAIPVAWAVLPGNRPGRFGPRIAALLEALAGRVPRGRRVLFLADRGLWSPRLWQGVRALGWHPLLRIQNHAWLRLPDGTRRQVGELASPGGSWRGRGILGRRRLPVTLWVRWAAGAREPWALVGDLPPSALDPALYGQRMWIENGFRGWKSAGFQWHRTRRTDPVRAERHLLVVALASLLALWAGTRAEETAPPQTAPRRTSLLRRGLYALQPWIMGHAPAPAGPLIPTQANPQNPNAPPYLPL